MKNKRAIDDFKLVINPFILVAIGGIAFSLFFALIIYSISCRNEMTRECISQEHKGRVIAYIEGTRAIWFIKLSNNDSFVTSSFTNMDLEMDVEKGFKIQINDSINKPRNKPYFLYYRKNKESGIYEFIGTLSISDMDTTAFANNNWVTK